MERGALEPAHQRVGLALQGRQAEIAAVLDDDLEAPRGAQAWHRRRVEHHDLRVLHPASELLAQLGHDGVGTAFGLASSFVERVKDDEHRAEIGTVGLRA